MFYKEKGFYISLICGIVCLVAFGAICMNVFSDSGKDQGKYLLRTGFILTRKRDFCGRWREIS